MDYYEGKEMKKFNEHFKRSLVKAVTFRAVILVSDSLIIYTITKRLDVTIGVMSLSNLASTLLYFLHERVWNNIVWGKSV